MARLLRMNVDSRKIEPDFILLKFYWLYRIFISEISSTGI